MKLEKHHTKLIADEFEARYKERKFPDEIAEMLDDVPQEKMLRIIHDNSDPTEEGPVLESIILAFSRPSFLIQQKLL